VPNDLPETAEPLYVTYAAGKLHIRPCPHLQDTKEPTLATDDQRRDNELCSWCRKEISGEGRRYFDNLEDGLRAFGHVSDESLRPIRDAVAGVEHDTVWIPPSGSYLALGRAGIGIAWIGWGYVAVKGRPLVELPWFQQPSGGGQAAEQAWGELCEVHFVEKSVTGACDLCD